MKPYYTSDTVTVYAGDCLNVLAELDDTSVDAVVTDPPYGLEFMGKEWDRPWSGRGDKPAGADLTTGGFDSGNGYINRRTPSYGKPWMNKRCLTCGHLQGGGSPCQCPESTWVIERQHPAISMRGFQQWCEQWARECLRVLKPGGHMLAFGGTRTWHRLAAAVEDAGFEIRDSIAWLYGSGFPKSLDVSKAIDKAAGAEREVKAWREAASGGIGMGLNVQCPDCSKWMRSPDPCRCPRDSGPQTDAAREWQGWGTALKPAFEPIIVARKPLTGTVAQTVLEHGTGALNIDGCRIDGGSRPLVVSDRRSGNDVYGDGLQGSRSDGATAAGRWPANVVLDESQAAALDAQSGTLVSGGGDRGTTSRDGLMGPDSDRGRPTRYSRDADAGGASRFFYTAKADAAERIRVNGVAHPTVKPLDLMRWLVRLVTPPGGVVLDPFAGSGTTIEACILERFRCVAIEREADYLPLITQRINRRRDPVAYFAASDDDPGLFGVAAAEPGGAQ